jgi:hypothetical protein
VTAALLVVGRERRRDGPAPRGVEVVPVRRADLFDTARSLIEGGTRRFSVVGSDADSATVVAAAVAAGSRIALTPAPRRRSDLLDMFALSPGGHVERLIAGTPYPIDVGVIASPAGRRIFLNSVTAGAAAGRPTLFPWWPPLLARGTVSVSGRRRRSADRAVAVFVMNGQRWGANTVAPRASLGDGAVDIQIVAGRRRDIAGARSALRRGLHATTPMITRVSVDEAEVSIPPAWRVHADRRMWGRGSFTVSVIPDALDLLI